MQQGDVLIRQTPDGGEITIEDGITEMTQSFESCVYLALFGGNKDDDGTDDNPRTWWGNRDEDNPSRQYRSRTQNLLESIPAVPANLRRIEQAASLDLEFFITEQIASEVTVAASIPGVNKVQLSIQIGAFGRKDSFNFVENWMASANES